VWLWGRDSAISDVTLYPVEEFYRISWRDDDRRRLLAAATDADEIFKGSQLLHFWHSLFMADLENFRRRNNSVALDSTLAGLIFSHSCPSLSNKSGVIQINSFSTMNFTASAHHFSGLSVPPFQGTWSEYMPSVYKLIELMIVLEDSSWTVSFWIYTKTLEATPRIFSRQTPDPTLWGGESGFCMPFCKMGIPETSVHKNSTSARLSLNISVSILVLAIEDGRLTLGNQHSEWVRSISRVADGQWHFVSVSFETRSSQLRLSLDGIRQAELHSPSLLGQHAVFEAFEGSLFTSLSSSS